MTDAPEWRPNFKPSDIIYSPRGRVVSDAAREFRRRRGPDKIVKPTERDWKLYRAAIDALEAATESDFINVDADIEEPHERREMGDYTETEDEYRHRIALLIAEHGIPDDIDRALPMKDLRTLSTIEGDNK